MIRRNEPRKEYHVCGTPNAMCDTDCVENAHKPPYMLVQLNFDRESFDALKGLLRKEAASLGPCESARSRMSREALKRVFDQIRDVHYDDKIPPIGLDYE